jgi:hypothetical protein
MDVSTMTITATLLPSRQEQLYANDVQKSIGILENRKKRILL